jgi:hypothetical protein
MTPALCFAAHKLTGVYYDPALDEFQQETPSTPIISLTRKPEFCEDCGHSRFKSCSLGYKTTARSKACRQAINKDAAKRSY